MNKQTVCPVCQSKMIWNRRTIRYEREGVQFTLENIWVSSCSKCGQEIVPGPLAIQMLNLADQLFRSSQQLQAATHLPMPRVSFSFPETETVPEALLSHA